MSQVEIRQHVTSQIIAAIENGVVPWRRSWRSLGGGRHRNAFSDRSYTGINPWLLELTALEHRFVSRCWGTFRQWTDLGCKIRKRPADVAPGAWGAKILFTKPVNRTKIDRATGKETEDRFQILKQYTIFNVDQVDGDSADCFRCITPEDTTPNFGPADELIEATGIELHFGGDRAFYKRPTPSGSWPHHADGDFVSVPHKSQFESQGAYYETVLHELAHAMEVRLGWTGTYPMGELIAEMSACFLSQELGIPNCESLENHAAYLQSWLKEMSDDPSFIFKASKQASIVADKLLSCVPKETPVEA